MRHIFKAKRMGWEEKEDIVWFDTKEYSKKKATSMFRPFKGTTRKGYPYTGYEYDGEKYHDYTYLGKVKDNEMPQNDTDILKLLVKKVKKKN